MWHAVPNRGWRSRSTMMRMVQVINYLRIDGVTLRKQSGAGFAEGYGDSLEECRGGRGRGWGSLSSQLGL